MLQQQIQQLNAPILIHDNATGGRLQQTLANPHNYKLLHFSPQLPLADYALEVTISGLDEYWLGKEANHSQLVINDTTHQIPYRGARSLDYAVEFCCFELCHIL